MRKSLLLIPVLAAMAAISACGNSGEKGRVLARIDGQTFTEGDLDLRLSTLEDARRQEVLANPDLRRAEFENILKLRLYALAGQQSAHGKSKPTLRRLASLEKRVFTQYYFETYLQTQGGRTRAELEAFYKANPKSFTDDSGTVKPFGSVISLIVDTLIVRDGNVDSFYQANKARYLVRASAEASAIRTTSRKNAEAALKALRGGATFASTAKRYSTLPSKDNEGRLGRISQGDFRPEFGAQEVLDSLVFSNNRLKPGATSGIVAAADGFSIIRLDSYTAEAAQPLESIRAQVNADFVREHKESQSKNAVTQMRAKHKVSLVSQDKLPTESEIRAYYKAHQAEYESPETFDLYHVEATDEAKLTTEFSKVKDLEGFKALASRISENGLTKGQQGALGVVKRDFSLPYGVGMLPALFPALDEIESGRVDELVQNPSTQTWHAFWLVRKSPAQAKSFDRVKGLVAQDFKANRIANIAPSDTLAVIGKSGKVLLEDDVMFLRQEIPANMQERYTRENLLDYLIIWEVFTAELRDLGVDTERKLRAMRLQNEDNFWSAIYRDSLLPKTWEVNASVLEKKFKSERKLFTRDSAAKDWKPFARDIAASLHLNAKDYDIEYNINPERYTRDSVTLSFADAKTGIFENLKSTAYARLEVAVLDALKKRFKVRLEDETLNVPSLNPPAAHYKKAQDFHYDRKLDQALSIYERLRTEFPANEGLQDSVGFGIAQIYIEQERYAQALAEYRRVNYLYPKSPNDYKAMFMIGFIQAEHLRLDSAAVKSFEAMLKKYPESDLSDDADWMIRNIRSGGQLMPTLEEDVEEGGMSKEPGK